MEENSDDKIEAGQEPQGKESEQPEPRKISKEELKEILEAHSKWLQSEGKEGTRADLGAANLQGAYLWGANLQGAYLERANLQNANLGFANLREVGLWEANLQNASLGGANLQEAVLWNADLQEAHLWGANLRGADLGGANLQEANLEDANLQGANLTRANLTAAIGLTVEQLCEVKTLYEARLDAELIHQIKEKYPHLLEPPKEN
jgi:hypothetical protein